MLPFPSLYILLKLQEKVKTKIKLDKNTSRTTVKEISVDLTLNKMAIVSGNYIYTHTHTHTHTHAHTQKKRQNKNPKP
jgi:hypothetical protein